MQIGHISRKAVLNLLDEMGDCDATDEWAKGWDKAIDTVYNEIIKFPEAKPRIRRGEWKQNGDIFECSECEYSFEHGGYLAYFNYCPCCGAKMK